MTLRDAAHGEGGRRLTGWTVLAITIACFGVVIAANGLLAYYALSTFRGDADPSPYEHGLAYEKDIVAARQQDERAWKVSEHVARDAGGGETIEVRFLDSAGAPIAGLSVVSGFDSPADKKLDRDVILTESAPGIYAGRIDLGPGQWDVNLEATRDGEQLFKSVNRVSLR